MLNTPHGLIQKQGLSTFADQTIQCLSTFVDQQIQCLNTWFDPHIQCLSAFFDQTILLIPCLKNNQNFCFRSICSGLRARAAHFGNQQTP